MSEYLASNRAGVRFSLLRWWLNRPLWPSIWACLILLGGGLVAAKSLVAGSLLIGVGLTALLLLRRRLAYVFAEGDVVPGMVIDLKPPLVGMLIDLTKDEQGPLAVKILPYPRRSVLGKRLAIGQRVPIACTYCGKDSEPWWNDVDPEWLEDGCGNTAVLNRILASQPEEDWVLLNDAVSALPYRAAGVYQLQSTDEEG